MRILNNLLSTKPHVRFIRFQWQDYSGILRGRVVPLEYGLRLAKSDTHVSLSPIAFQCQVDNTFIPWLDARGTHYMVADWPSLKVINEAGPGPSYATVMCSVFGKLPMNSGLNQSFCPRQALVDVVNAAAKQFDINFLVGMEVEFEVMRVSDGNIVPMSAGFGRYAIDGLRDPCYQYLEEAVQELLEAGVSMQTIQAEGIRGQYEISLGPLPPISAIDQLVLVHDTLKRVFARHGCIVTMSPVTAEDPVQALGQHTHISINQISHETRFLAGILKRLPILCAFSMPYEISYARCQKYMGGEAVAWGSEDRAATVRKIKPGHWELRSIDATANMYITLAAVLGAGLLGIQHDEPFIWPDTGLEENSSAISQADRLPASLIEALDALNEGIQDLGSVVSTRLLKDYLSVKRCEAERLKNMEPTQLREMLIRLF